MTSNLPYGAPEDQGPLPAQQGYTQPLPQQPGYPQQQAAYYPPQQSYPQQGGYYPPQQHFAHFPPPHVAPLVQPDVMQSRDRAQYVRQQKGHSLLLHLLFGWILLWIPAIYYTVSPNHYWHM